MTYLPKPLTNALKPHTEKGIEDLVKHCVETSCKFKDVAALLENAAEAYRIGDTGTGLTMLRHAQDRLDKKP